MRKFFTSVAGVALATAAVTSAIAQDGDGPPPILFTNVDVFDGFGPDLIEGANVLVEGNVITQVSTDPIEVEGAFEVDATGKTMTPGFIDMHQHVMFNNPDGTGGFKTKWDKAAAGAFAHYYMNKHILLKGITSIRDIAGDPLDLAVAYDAGMMPGPRIISSGGAISETGGHGDFLPRNTSPAHMAERSDPVQRDQMGWVVDGPEEVAKAARLNFRRGAGFLKVMGWGGVASEFDPLEIMGLAEDELAKAVEIAADQGTYVATHAYNDASYDRHLRLGTRSFEHGFLISEEMVQRMVAKYEETQDIVWSFQCYMSIKSFASRESMPEWFSEDQKDKGEATGAGAVQVANWMNEYDMFTVGGSDMYSPGLVEKIKEDITCNVDAGFTPAEALKHWTGNAGIVMAWSGPRNPYASYHLGRIAPDSWADILIWNGNPLEDINLILDESKLQLVMKDGRAYKNTMVDSDSIMYRPAVSEPRIYP